MNFLSHFYFERQTENDYVVMGMVLPDLVKNAHKDWNLNPQKDEYLFRDVPEYAAVLEGWKRHLLLDQLFHSSAFFKEQTAILKQLIMPALQTGPVKPFFLAHIGLELVLDHLLLTKTTTNADRFYQQLQAAHSEALAGFLRLAGLPDQAKFDLFLDQFLSSRYLFSYEKIENVTYALNRICMRLWKDPFKEPQLALLTAGLEKFKDLLEKDFISIFEELDKELNG